MIFFLFISGQRQRAEVIPIDHFRDPGLR